MHFRLIPIIGLALLVLPASAQQYLEMIDAGTYPVTEIQQAAEAHFKIVGKGRGSGYKQFKRWEYVALMELDDSGVKIPNDELSRRGRDYRRAARQQRAESGNFGGAWKQLGPTYSIASSSWSPGLGRVTAIGIDNNDFNHLIVGSPTGGVWKSTTAGNSWTPIADEYTSIDVYALEISPYDNQQYLWGSTSGKVFRSLDGGASWMTTGNLSGNGKVSRILYHPTDPNIVYAVSESNGLFRSANKGSTWTAVTGASGVVGYDVEFKPGDPNTIYFSGISVYRSMDGGTSFSQIGGFGTANNNYKRMGVSPADPNVVYVLEAQGGKFGGFYKSTDSGASFTKLVDGATINYLGYSEIGDDDKGQAPRNMAIAIDPLYANEVHIGGVHTWKSVNGGISFELSSYWVPGTAADLGVGYNHADIDILKFAGNTLLVGTDGGFFTSINRAASFEDHSYGLSIKELYKIGVSKTNPNVVTGGSQDNGTCVMRGTNRAFVDFIGADGMETFVDWSNANNLYGTSQLGSMYYSSNQGTSIIDISKPLDVDGAWVTPFEQDPQVANTIYVAFADVWKSTNKGVDWTKISSFDNGNMSQMKLAPSDNQRIYVSRGSSLFTTANGGTTWTTTGTGWGTNGISYIAVHPQNPQRLLIVTANGVFHSIDAGVSWVNISTGLPAGSKYCATWEYTGKNGMYVGGFGFVAYTNDELGGVWTGFFDGLPNARVYELEINYISNTIFAGTYGRGLWESQLYKGLAPVAVFSADRQEGCGETKVNFTDHSANSPTAWAWTFEGGTPATSTLQHPTVTFNGSGVLKVRLKSSNGIGESVLEAVDSIFLFGPPPPFVADVQRCGPGEVILEATGHPANEIHWYASATDQMQLFTGESFTTNLAQTTSFFTTASTDYFSVDSVGPASRDIGGGADHAGGRFLILDASKPFRLKSATVYATGAGNRTFQLKNASGAVLLEKVVYIEDGEQRILLDMDIPQGTDLQLGCISPAGLFRNSSGVNYPYSVPGVMQFKTSTGGIDYYYYLYDMDIESSAVCESERVEISGIVDVSPAAPVIAAAGATVLCPGESVVLAADNACVDCIVHWSNGETGSSILVSTAGNYTAILSPSTENTCGDSPASNMIVVTESSLPGSTTLTTSGQTILCPGASVELTADNNCPDCSVFWSNGETGNSITVSTEGIFTAMLRNTCGEGSVSNEVLVSTVALPVSPMVSSAGAATLCPGESVELMASDICPGCIVNWSTGETGSSITVSTGGLFTATTSNLCGDSPASDILSISTETLPPATTVSAAGSTAICPGGSVVLSAENVCSGCIVHWSTGETGPDITVSSEGNYTAFVRNNCGLSPVSNAVEITVGAAPAAPAISASGPTAFCLGQSVLLTAENGCPDCPVNWSNGETGPSITVETGGVYSASSSNVCGSGPASDPIFILTGVEPPAPMISASDATALCPGESIQLFADNVCPDCIVNWSNAATGLSITVSSAGTYTATVSDPDNDLCGDSPASNAVIVSVNPPFLAVVQNNLCHLTAPAGSGYQWFLDGIELVGANGQNWTALVAGNYTVSMMNSEGCMGVSEPIFAEACVSSVQDIAGLVSTRVYPNPTLDRVFLDIQVLRTTSAQLNLYAADGRLVGHLFQGDLLTGGQILDIALPALPSGIYQYRLITEMGNLNGNLVVQRP